LCVIVDGADHAPLRDHTPQGNRFTNAKERSLEEQGGDNWSAWLSVWLLYANSDESAAELSEQCISRPR
jgi:hypothetical protein